MTNLGDRSYTEVTTEMKAEEIFWEKEKFGKVYFEREWGNGRRVSLGKQTTLGEAQKILRKESSEMFEGRRDWKKEQRNTKDFKFREFVFFGGRV
jgi:hypothetical protein